jgi:hypothetical protein
MAPLPHHREKHPGMLDAPIRIGQQWTHGTNLRPLRMLEQHRQPVGVADFDIVIEE